MDNLRPKTSIVIRAFNEEKHIGELLKICFEQETSFRYEVILVDSGSTDRTLEIARAYPIKLEHISPSEFTFGKSLNLGIKKAAGDFCVVISAHCFPTNKFWLEEMIKPFTNPNVCMVYGKQRGDHRTKYSEKQIFIKWFPELSLAETDFAFCNNANSAIRKSEWELYPFDEHLTGLEDLDWAKNLTGKKKKLAYSGEATVLHIHEETPQQIFRRYFREAVAFKEIYPGQKFTLYNFLQFFILNVVSDYLHSIKDGAFVENITSIPTFRFNQFWATYKAHNNYRSINSDMQRRLFYPRNPKWLLQKK